MMVLTIIRRYLFVSNPENATNFVAEGLPALTLRPLETRGHQNEGREALRYATPPIFILHCAYKA